jgi:hypothetical protein
MDEWCKFNLLIYFKIISPFKVACLSLIKISWHLIHYWTDIKFLSLFQDEKRDIVQVYSHFVMVCIM